MVNPSRSNIFIVRNEFSAPKYTRKSAYQKLFMSGEVGNHLGLHYMVLYENFLAVLHIVSSLNSLLENGSGSNKNLTASIYMLEK